MTKTIPFTSLADEETARLEWFRVFMHERVKLEQQTIAGLQELLKKPPRLPDSKLLWHRALEELLNGTRNELNTRMEELQKLKDQLQAVESSIANVMNVGGLQFEFEKLESTTDIDSAQAATETLYGDWLAIESVDLSVQKGLSNLFSSSRAQKEKLEIKRNLLARKAREASEKFYEQDLKYRRIVHQQRHSQKQFLSSIPDRVQEYGTKHCTTVREVGMAMESFASYLRNVSSTCNSSGSATWALANDIKPLVDANCHTEAIQVVYHQSPIRFSRIHYRSPGCEAPYQTILFGCPLELYTVGELKKIPAVLEYLLDSVRDWPGLDGDDNLGKGNTWPLVNELEQAWTGVEATDRAVISRITPDDRRALIVEYFWTLPEPVWSEDDIEMVEESIRNPSSSIRHAWNKEPTKFAVLRAVASCRAMLGEDGDSFDDDIVDCLAQKWSSSRLDSVLLSLSRHPDFLGPPASVVPEGTQ